MVKENLKELICTVCLPSYGIYTLPPCYSNTVPASTYSFCVPDVNLSVDNISPMEGVGGGVLLSRKTAYLARTKH